jgi:nucleotide-binding universal stress UspA family protein
MEAVATAVDTRIKSVLIATDLSETSDKPLRHALAIAHHYGAKLYLGHVVSSLGYTMAGGQAIHLASEAAAREMEHLRDKLIENGSFKDLEYECIVRQGDTWKQLESIIQEKRIDLVVTGTHGRHTLGKVLLGSVAEQIFRGADCRVLTVGPCALHDSPLEKTRPFRCFLFATDFGDASLRAFPDAIGFANQFRVKLILLHVAPAIPIPESFHWSRTSNDVRKLQEDAREVALKQFEDIARNAVFSVRPEFQVKFGLTGETIQQVAHTVGADLIVMGLNRTRHTDSFSHLPGTIPYQVVCAAHCPVLTIRS